MSPILYQIEKFFSRVVLSLSVLLATLFISSSLNAQCDANAGTLGTAQICAQDVERAVIKATPNGDANTPEGFFTYYVLTSGDELVIEGLSPNPTFEVEKSGSYTIHTLVFDPTTLDLSIVQAGTTTGFDVNGLLEQGGGAICASLDVAGAKFSFESCETVCNAFAGTLAAVSDSCFSDGTKLLIATPVAPAIVPEGYETIFVLTSGEGLVINGVSATPEFLIEGEGLFTIHTLVYNPSTLDLGIIEFGVTTGVDVNGLLIQGGGDICASLDVAGASFDIDNCPCEATSGSLTATESCLDELSGTAVLTAEVNEAANVPDGFSLLYVLTSGEGLVIENVNDTPEFTVDTTGRFTIHSLVYNPSTLDLGIIEFGVTTGVDVNGLLIQGGGTICAALDVAGAAFDVENCPCEATSGSLTATESCLDELSGTATLTAEVNESANVPEGYSLLYVLTSGEGLVIENVSETAEFTVDAIGRYTIHTLVYNPNTLDLGIIEFGVTTGVDVNGLLIQGGGDICAALDVAGAAFDVENCPCEATSGSLTATESCLDELSGTATLTAEVNESANVPEGYSLLYVLTSGEGLVIENVSETAEF
ncbi:MAG: hypothetical protein AAFO07_23560, partial [Bacteroidota bacterium]